MTTLSQPRLEHGRVVIAHDDPDYTPWTVEAARPRRRDFWRVLLGRYEPRVLLNRRYTTAGFDKMLKRVWAGPEMRDFLNQRSELLFTEERNED